MAPLCAIPRGTFKIGASMSFGNDELLKRQRKEKRQEICFGIATILLIFVGFPCLLIFVMEVHPTQVIAVYVLYAVLYFGVLRNL